MSELFHLDRTGPCHVLQLVSGDGTNRLSRDRVIALTHAIHLLYSDPKPLIIRGNERYFSVGADLTEIAQLNRQEALHFAAMGQGLMSAIAEFPAPTCAVIEGWCMGGGFDLALACRIRVAGPNAVFGHRGAALGLRTGWGGTQRLPRLIGKAKALEIFLTATKLQADDALRLGIVERVEEHPVRFAKELLERSQ